MNTVAQLSPGGKLLKSLLAVDDDNVDQKATLLYNLEGKNPLLGSVVQHILSLIYGMGWTPLSIASEAAQNQARVVWDLNRNIWQDSIRQVLITGRVFFLFNGGSANLLVPQPHQFSEANSLRDDETRLYTSLAFSRSVQSSFTGEYDLYDLIDLEDPPPILNGQNYVVVIKTRQNLQLGKSMFESSLDTLLEWSEISHALAIRTRIALAIAYLLKNFEESGDDDKDKKRMKSIKDSLQGLNAVLPLVGDEDVVPINPNLSDIGLPEILKTKAKEFLGFHGFNIAEFGFSEDANRASTTESVRSRTKRYRELQSNIGSQYASLLRLFINTDAALTFDYPEIHEVSKFEAIEDIDRETDALEKLNETGQLEESQYSDHIKRLYDKLEALESSYA